MNALGNAAKAVVITLGVCAAIGLIVLLSPLLIAFGYLLLGFAELLLPLIIFVVAVAVVYYIIKDRKGGSI